MRELESRIFYGALKPMQTLLYRKMGAVAGGQIRRATYLGPRQYRFQDQQWKRAVLPVNSVSGETVFFRGRLELPRSARPDQLMLKFSFLNTEGLLALDGRPFCGLDANHTLVPLGRSARGAGLDFEIEFYFLKRPCADFDLPFGFYGLELVEPNQRMIEYYYNLKVALEIFEKSAAGDRNWMEPVLEESLRRLVLEDEQAPEPANRVLVNDFYGRKNLAHDFDLVLQGHSHIDTAWLWPIVETVRKCGRTFATALRWMERDPGFIFSASQPQQYDFVKRYYPDLYRQMRRRIAEGRWEPMGAFWVESDCNCVSGESLARQMLYGKKFFKEEFGREVKTVWLPDTFGYAGQLPQIMREADADCFYSFKLYWMSVNRWPLGLFWWEGIDGSRVLANAPKLAGGYGGRPNPDQFTQAEAEFRQKDLFPKTLLPFGYGDGGGGVTLEMLEYAKRLRHAPTLPRSAYGTVDSHRQAALKAKNLPVWKGELYLETHQGCYSSQALTKKNNRTAENLLHTAELLHSLNAALGNPAPFANREALWKKTLLFQFHDILPGSSIGEVYREIEPQYAEIIGALKTEIRSSLARLAGKVARADAKGPAVLVFNPLNWARRDVIEVKPGRAVEVELPAGGYAVLGANDLKQKLRENSLVVAANRLENRFFSVRLNARGRIVSLFDKVNRKEVVAPGAEANDLRIFKDWSPDEAWNIDLTYKTTERSFGRLLGRKIVERGPARGILRQTFRDGKSTLVQDIVIYAGIPRIDFRTRVEWLDRRKMIKAAFPVAVSAPEAFYEIPFGAIGRPTTNRDSWEEAKEECAALRWADLSDDEYGVAILNDCKYGYDIKGHTIRLTLLRAPAFPDPLADEGTHEFTYSIFPHRGNWRNADVFKQGYELNYPALVCPLKTGPARGAALPQKASLLRTDGLPVVVSAFKPAEDNAGYVLRIYEPNGRSGNVRVTLPAAPKTVWESNLLERKKAKIAVKDNAFICEIQPYRIKTFFCAF